MFLSLLPISLLQPELSIFWNSELGHNKYESHLNFFPSKFCPIYSSKFKIQKEKSINLEELCSLKISPITIRMNSEFKRI